MENKHTPAPWMLGTTGDRMKGYGQTFAISEFNKPNLIAGIFGDVRGGDETAEANARLIAAAPELLEALETLVDPISGNFWVEYQSVIKAKDRKKILSAIAKAKSKDQL